MTTTPTVDALTLAAPAPATVDGPRRRITGLILTWSDVAATSAGRTRFAAGSLRWTDPRRVALLREHDRTTPLGYAVELAATPDGVVATFHLPPGPDGDRALAEAASGLRSGLSVGAELDAAEHDTDGVLVVTAARLREVSQVSVPAYDSARVLSVAAAARLPEGMLPVPTATVTEPDPATQPAPAQPAPADPAPAPAPAPADPPPPAPAPAPAPAPQQGWTPHPTVSAAAPRTLDLSGLTHLIAGAYNGQVAPGELRAALSDIIPGNSGGFFRPTYLTELWDGATATRPLIDSVTTRPLPRTMRIVAHRWVTRPAVDDYAGDKAPVPSNPVAMEDITVNVERTAGAHDIDRAYLDLGSPDYLASYFAAMTDSYRRQTEAKLAGYLAATAPTLTDGTPATLLDGVVAGVVELATLGETADFVALSAGLVTELFAITAMDAPAFYGGAFSLRNAADGTLGGLRFVTTPALPAGMFIVGSRASTVWWEANPPVRVQAYDVANGGVDCGLFGYHAAAVVNANALRRGTVTPAA